MKSQHLARHLLIAKKILPFNTGDAIGCLGLAALAWMRYGKRVPLAEQWMEGDQF